MSIGEARNTLEAAKEDFLRGREHTTQGQAAADAAVSKYAEAEGLRNETIERAEKLVSLMQEAGAIASDLGVMAARASVLQGELSKMGRDADNSFTFARRAGTAGRTKLAEVVGGQEAANSSTACVENSRRAAFGAMNTWMRAARSRDQLGKIATGFNETTEMIGTLYGQAELLAAALHLADLTSDDAVHAIETGEIDYTDDRKARAADGPANALQYGTAAAEAFDTTIQSVDERIQRLS